MARYKSTTGRQEARMYRFGADDSGTTVVACQPCKKTSYVGLFAATIAGVFVADYITRQMSSKR